MGKKRVKKLMTPEQLRNYINKLPNTPEINDLKAIANVLLDEIDELYKIVANSRSDYSRVQALNSINSIKKEYIKLLQEFSILPSNNELSVNIRNKTKEELMEKIQKLDPDNRQALLGLLINKDNS